MESYNISFDDLFARLAEEPPEIIPEDDYEPPEGEPDTSGRLYDFAEDGLEASEVFPEFMNVGKPRVKKDGKRLAYSGMGEYLFGRTIPFGVFDSSFRTYAKKFSDAYNKRTAVMEKLLKRPSGHKDAAGSVKRMSGKEFHETLKDTKWQYIRNSSSRPVAFFDASTRLVMGIKPGGICVLYEGEPKIYIRDQYWNKSFCASRKRAQDLSPDGELPDFDSVFDRFLVDHAEEFLEADREVDAEFGGKGK